MVQTVYDKILNYMGTESVPCVIVGQKSDLHVQRWVHAAAAIMSTGKGYRLTRYQCKLADK